MGELNKQEVHYLHLSVTGGGKEEWEKEKRKASALLYQADVREEPAYSSLAQRPASDRLGTCQPGGLGDTVPFFAATIRSLRES